MASVRTPSANRFKIELSFRDFLLFGFHLLIIALFPSPLGRFGDQTFFDGAGRDANVTDFAIDHRFDALKIREKATLGDGRDVRADAAFFLCLATAPDVAAFNGAGAS